LTNIPFPIGEELCTRFATRIVSKRAELGERDTIRVTIEAGDANPFNREENIAAAEAYKPEFESLTAENFASVIKEVDFM